LARTLKLQKQTRNTVTYRIHHMLQTVINMTTDKNTLSSILKTGRCPFTLITILFTNTSMSRWRENPSER